MKSIHSKKRYLGLLLSLIMIFTLLPFSNKESVTVHASGEVFNWKSIIFGQSTGTGNTITTDNVNNAVTVTAGSKDGTTTGGKITGSHDGISYYYTEIDPTKNFDISADIKVNFFAKTSPDNQEAFGIMARDAIGTNLDATPFPSNMVMVGGYRGLVQSVFRDNVKESSGAGAIMEGVTKFGDRPANDGTATYKMTMKKTNTGYLVNVDNGTEKIYYKPKQLEVLNSGKIYVGFFAARVASITVSNIALKTSDVATDAPRIPEPKATVAPSINLVSLSAASISNYDFSLLSNIKGNIQIKQNGKEVYNNLIEGNKILTKNTTLVSGDNTFDVVYTPDPTESITSKTSISKQYVVSFKNYGTVNGAIYVSPKGIATADGTVNNPIDIYSALKFISVGQTIYARGGTYNLTAPVTITSGNNGTSDKLKVLSAYANEKPIFDFGTTSGGFSLAGDYWKIYGFDFTKATGGGLSVSGNHNDIELVNTYANGNAGFQVSGSGKDIANWPSYNLIVNCTSYDNRDASENNADGFAAKITCGVGNVFRGCISHNNCDDGWDLYSKLESGPIGAVTVENCVSYGNGNLSDGTPTLGDGNGFKLGGEGFAVKHILKNSLSFNNQGTGITSNSDPAITVQNCTSVDNVKANYDFSFYTTVTPAFIADNNISFRTTSGGPADNFTAALASDTNYFYNGTVSQNKSGKIVLASDFKSVAKPSSFDRNTDGTIATGEFMALSSASTIKAGATLPKTGYFMDMKALINIGFLLIIIGTAFVLFNKKDRANNK